MKTIHLASMVRSDGAISARCSDHPRAISKRASWTYREGEVTCPRCLALISPEREEAKANELFSFLFGIGHSMLGTEMAEEDTPR